MANTRLVRIGNSFGIVIPRKYLNAMSWWQGDVLYQEMQNGVLVVRNMTQKNLQPLHAKVEYGDLVSRKAQRSIRST